MELCRHSRTFIWRLSGQTDLPITMADYPESRRYISIMMVAQATVDRWLQMLRGSLKPSGLLCYSSIFETHSLFPFNSSWFPRALVEDPARFSRHHELLITQGSFRECPRLPPRAI